MEAYAVIQTGGKQYRVSEGSVLDVEVIDAEAGKQVNLDEVLALSDGNELTIGTPTISGASVTAEVVDHLRGEKVVAFKKKRRKGYRKKIGHRQNLTRVKVISLGAAKKKAAPKAKKEEAEAAAE